MTEVLRERQAQVSGTKLGAWTIVLLVAASFGSALAFMVPMVFTLALRVDQIDPGNQAFLGVIIGSGSVVTLLAAPLTGILSDRTRSSWGRRRPFTVVGMIVGLASVPLMAFAPDLLTLTLSWAIASVGWGTAMGSIGNYQADRLPPSQRGMVAGLTGVMAQVAPIVGILLVGLVPRDPLMVILLPVLVGTPLVVLFVCFVHDEDSRGLVFDERLTAWGVVKSFGFSPREFPAFAWNWLGRFVFFGGISLTTTYSTFFYAHRMGIPVQDIAPIIAVVSVLGIGSSTLGALVGGSWSDRLGRRRPFILGSSVVFAVGAAVMAVTEALPVLLCGAALSSLGVAMFLAVNQAMVLDVLPHRETQAGRFMAITAFSQKIPSAIAPMLAPFILAIDSASATNYAALYLITGSLVVVGGIIVVTKVRSVR